MLVAIETQASRLYGYAIAQALALAHLRSMRWLNHNHNALVSGLGPGIFVYTHVFFGHTINERIVGIIVDANNTTTYFQIAIGVGWIDN